MKKTLCLFFIAMLSVVLIGCGGDSTEKKEEVSTNFDLQITVLSSDDESPINNAEVTIGEETQSTDESGLVTFTLSNASYSVVISASGFNATTDSVIISGSDLTNEYSLVALDTTVPEISLIGDANMTITVGDVYEEPGSNVTDNVDTGLTATISGEVDTETAGTYILTYAAEDSAGNSNSIVREVVVEGPVFVSNDAYIFHSEYDDTFFMEFWADPWDSGTSYADVIDDPDFTKVLAITSGTAWGNIASIAWGNTVENIVDVSEFTHVKFKVKPGSFTSVDVVVQSATSPESRVGYLLSSAQDVGNGWVEVEARLPGFSDMSWFTLMFDGPSSDTLQLADVYFTTQDIVLTGPTSAAPIPSVSSNDDVIVLYSDTLIQDSFVSVWDANWWNAPLYSEGEIAGDHYARYEITGTGVEGGVVGIEYGIENGSLDASQKTTWNFDLFVETGITRIELQLVSDDGSALYTLDTPVTGEWVSYDVLFADMVDADGDGPGVLSPSTFILAGIKLWGQEGQSVYLDNVYFSGESNSFPLNVNVTDVNALPIVGAAVSVGSNSAITDINGEASLVLSEGDHRVLISADGYGLAQGNQIIAGDEANFAITLQLLNAGPVNAAPLPTLSNDDAIALYSDTLSVDKFISFWEDNWWNAPNYSEVQFGGNNTVRYQIVPDGISGGVVGIQYGIDGGVVDASASTGMHFDLFATSGITQGVFQIVSSDGPGIVTINPLTTGAWISIDILFSDVVDPQGTFNPAALTQLGVQLWGTTSDSIYIDNIYFY
ncbi:MAG: hypothetical protein ACI93R_002883 [Flavobacteriales bacterium]|jgi:hypothetical protein